MLTHYTRTPAAVANILTLGFVWFPNRRGLTHVLMPGHDFSAREPQQFGMISFTELEPNHAKAHCEQFGSFGIVVSDKWAAMKQAQRVIYIEEEGLATDALRAVFAIGYQDVKRRIKYPDDAGWLMAYENKVAARVIAGSALWANLLQIWEYMEPASSSHQREWRIVNPLPYYSLRDSKSEAIRVVSDPQNFARFTNVVTIPRQEVEAIVCPASQVLELRSVLPDNYKDISILQRDS